MLGKIALEEAFELPEDMPGWKSSWGTKFFRNNMEERASWIQDLNHIRVNFAKQFGVGYQILSHSNPGVQGVADAAEAAEYASRVNDYVATGIKDHKHCLGAFAALPMHNGQQAAEELRRCVTTYGFKGALVGDTQRSGPGGRHTIYFDQPEFDVLWRTCEELDVPFYLHPSQPSPIQYEEIWNDREFLVGPVESFANGVSVHTLGLIINGVFDRYPNLKFIIGHLGEKLPIDLWRINHWFEDRQPKTCKRTIYDYFKQNIWVTTSGDFSTPALQMCLDQLGADRILFSIDYPYEEFDAACPWFDKAPISAADRAKIGRENAKKLLKLGRYPDCDSAVTA